jgi:Predicted membrane protein (DUF2306)
MNTLVLSNHRDWHAVATMSLKSSVQFWFVVAMIGQWLFACYVVAFYDVPTVQGNFEAWKRNKMVPHGYVAGDVMGNLQFAGHVLLAGVMTLGGTLQLIPALRARVPLLHRWTGRMYIVTAIALSLGGLYMVWISGRRNHLTGGVAISLDAVLIIVCGVMAWRYAMARDFAAHRRWALRTFVVASGVWFMRIGYMAWILINQAPVGINDTSTGVFDLFWLFASFLLPLAVLEAWLRIGKNGSTQARFALAGVLVIATLVTGIGIFGAYMMMWRPLL